MTRRKRIPEWLIAVIEAVTAVLFIAAIGYASIWLDGWIAKLR